MSLRILLLDDNPDDRALAAREVRRAFPDVQVVEGSGRAGFDAAMAGGPLDLVAPTSRCAGPPAQASRVARQGRIAV